MRKTEYSQQLWIWMSLLYSGEKYTSSDGAWNFSDIHRNYVSGCTLHRLSLMTSAFVHSGAMLVAAQDFGSHSQWWLRNDCLHSVIMTHDFSVFILKDIMAIKNLRKVRCAVSPCICWLEMEVSWPFARHNFDNLTLSILLHSRHSNWFCFGRTPYHICFPFDVSYSNGIILLYLLNSLNDTCRKKI